MLCAESMYDILWRIGSNSKAYFPFDIYIDLFLNIKENPAYGVATHSVKGVAK